MPLLTGPKASRQIREMGKEGNVVGVTCNALQEDIL